MRTPILASCVRVGYRYALKPILFSQDPEKVHDRFLGLGVRLGKGRFTQRLASLAFGHHDPVLSRTVDGIHYASPIGLAAGLDKNAELLHILPKLGLGFAEIGSVTKRHYAGNTGKRLVRAPELGGIFVNYGLKSAGAEQVTKRVATYRSGAKGRETFPLGISIAPTNDGKCTEPRLMQEEYLWGVSHFSQHADYLTLNLSCPNTACGQPFLQPTTLQELLEQIPAETSVPIYIKISPDSDDAATLKLLQVASQFHAIKGVIMSNLTKDRSKLPDPKRHENVVGGLSGKILFPRTKHLVTLVRTTFGKRFTIIACGGITTAHDVYTLERAGADLVQVVSTLIFNGPSSIALMNAELAKLYRRNGLPRTP